MCCLLRVAVFVCCLLAGVICSLFVVRCSLFGVRCLLLVVWCSPCDGCCVRVVCVMFVGCSLLVAVCGVLFVG